MSAVNSHPCNAAGIGVSEGYNHYEIAETIANPYGFVGREILEQMRLRPA